jgi:hypothetical protein
MRTKIKVLFLLLLAVANSSAETAGDADVVSVSGTGQQTPFGYVPPLTSNGSLSLIVDYEGSQTQNSYYKMVPGIFKAGRRYGPPADSLIPLGHFETEASVDGRRLGAPEKWTQTLNKKDAVIACTGKYNNGLEVETVVFTHLKKNVVGVKRTFRNTTEGVLKIETSFRYAFTPPGNDNRPPRRVVARTVRNEESAAVDFVYEADAYQPFVGITSVLSDRPVAVAIDGQRAALTSEHVLGRNDQAEITYFVVLSDSKDGEEYRTTHRALLAEARSAGFGGLLESHKTEWRRFFGRSYVKLPEVKLEAVYTTSMYHLRANATKWSFPVGIFPTHWSGRYFGWDETFAFLGLVSSDHLDLSRRVPEFRFSVMRHAMDRAKHTSMTELNRRNYGAKFPWETLEDGRDGTPPGFWNEHIFHMAHIAMAAWMQYEYSGDREFLRKTGYPLIRECSRFLGTYHVYENADGSMFIGKVTDLERLGPARQNAFLTTAGVIYTMEIAAKAAEVLQESDAETARWRLVAAKLRESLPHNGERYIPYPGCREESIGTLGGLFPYPIFDRTNEMQRRAVYWFQERGLAFGNVTTKGESIGSWYAAKLAAAFGRLGDRRQTVHWLRKTTSSSGLFGELFEIHEPTISSVPWYAAVGGAYVYAVNQMLVQCSDGRIEIAPAVPETWQDFSFKLGCYDNLVAEATVRSGKLSRLTFVSPDPKRKIQRVIVIPKRLYDQSLLNRESVVKVEQLPDAVAVTLMVSGDTRLF